MKFSNGWLVRLMALLAVFGLIAAACGDDDDDSSGEATSDAGSDGGGEVEEITLRMFDNETGDLSPIWDEQIAAFEVVGRPRLTVVHIAQLARILTGVVELFLRCVDIFPRAATQRGSVPSVGRLTGGAKPPLPRRRPSSMSS